MQKAADSVDESQITRVEAIINSMTAKERNHHEIINGSRRKRIARGSGTSVQEVNQLLEQFNEMRTMMRQVASGKGPWARLARQYGGDGANMPAMSLPKPGGGGGKKTGKAARKEKRKQKARSRSGRR